MQPIVTEGVAWPVSQSVAVVSPAKMAEPIEMLFGCGLRWAEGTVYYMVVDPA